MSLQEQLGPGGVTGAGEGEAGVWSGQVDALCADQGLGILLMGVISRGPHADPEPALVRHFDQ